MKNTGSLVGRNWKVISHVYDGLVEVTECGLRNISLHPQHFKALDQAINHKEFKGRKRKDDSLLNSIGNWLCTKELGAWRNPNRQHPYLNNNKEIWDEFCKSISDKRRRFSLARALR